MVGLERSVLPLVGKDDFGLASKNAILSFVVAFGVAKALANLAAGGLAHRVGRRRLLLVGWLLALPVPLLIATASSWWLVVLANLFLGLNQGFAWSMTRSRTPQVRDLEDFRFRICASREPLGDVPPPPDPPAPRVQERIRSLIRDLGALVPRASNSRDASKSVTSQFLRRPDRGTLSLGARRSLRWEYRCPTPTVASKGGSPVHPGWYRNLTRNSNVEVQVEGDVFPHEHERQGRGARPPVEAGRATMARLRRVSDEDRPEIPVVVLERTSSPG